jgi:hypothetical protein
MGGVSGVVDDGDKVGYTHDWLDICLAPSPFLTLSPSGNHAVLGDPAFRDPAIGGSSPKWLG